MPQLLAEYEEESDSRNHAYKVQQWQSYELVGNSGTISEYWTCTCNNFLKGRHQHGRQIWERVPCKHILRRQAKLNSELRAREKDRIQKLATNVANLAPKKPKKTSIVEAFMESIGEVD